MSNYSPSDLRRLSEAFKALSNPNRLRIFLRLTSCCAPGTVWTVEEGQVGACVGDLGQDLDVAPSTVSHHIKELQRAGLIECERRGQKVECRIAAKVLEELSAFLSPPQKG
jgi:DNA-binding transcriptional ArsR family regulator